MRNRVNCSILGQGLILFLAVALVPTVLIWAADDLPSPNAKTNANPNASPGGDMPVPGTGKVIKSEKEWQKQLTRAQFLVTRMKATEPAFSGKLVGNHAIGTYACVCCGAPLFTSRAKFESGTGWPSFWSPYAPGRIQTAPDYHEAEPRVEVMCSRCDAHLGHVFSDGPPPTGLRFCVNSASLKFLPDTKAKTAKAKAKAAPKSETASAADPAPAPDAAPATGTSSSSPAPADPAKSPKSAP